MKNEAQAPEKLEKDHKEWLEDKGIAVVELPEALQEAVDAVEQAEKTETPEDVAAANKLLIEALQEWYHQLDDQIENIGEVLYDHEERIDALENGEVAEKKATEQVAKTPSLGVLTDEQILENLHNEERSYISKQELQNLGFKTGFFSKLTSRGGTYGAYKLVKQPSEKTYQIIQIVKN